MNWEELSEDSRVWIYQSNNELDKEQVFEIKKLGEAFIRNWAAHGKALDASFEIFYNRFLVIFADEEQAKASGCSIDASVHFMQDIEKKFKVELFDRVTVAVNKEDSVQTISLDEFRKRIQNGSLDSNSLVFNNLVENLGQFKNSWLVPVSKSWHNQFV